MGNLPFEILQWTLALAGLWLISGTLMNFSSHPQADEMVKANPGGRR